MSTAAACSHCGTGGFWGSLVDGVKRFFSPKRADRLMYIPVAEIQDNPVQPREYILEEPQEQLRKSIERYGVIVPLIVNRVPGGYQLVAGQRRLKASRELGYQYVPAIVRHLNRREVMEVSYLENLHRAELTSVDQVLMFDRIRRKYPTLSEDELAQTMGLKPEDIRQAREFLNFPIPIQEALRAGMIGEEHAYILEEVKDPDLQLEVIEMIYNDKLTRDEVRELVDRMTHKEAPFVTSEDGVHFHLPTCPYAGLIPENRRMKFYSKKEPAKRGKIPCMNCL